MGSPPQVRGKLSHTPCVLPHDRITPAGAGKTQFFVLAPRRDQDHPRRCGENPLDKRFRFGMEGSPPQVRGKLYQPSYAQCKSGITPADAGKTGRRCSWGGFGEDHPRGCGENKDPMPESRDGTGSPPRMRGKRAFCLSKSDIVRITPADAGKTTCFLMMKLLRRDHPRGCGENKST